MSDSSSPSVWQYDLLQLNQFLLKTTPVTLADRYLSKQTLKPAATMLETDMDSDSDDDTSPDPATTALNSQIQSASDTMTDSTVAERICAAVQSACSSSNATRDACGIMNVYQVQQQTSTTTTPLPGSILSRCNLNGIVNACLGIETPGGVVSFRDSSIIKSSKTDSETKTDKNLIIPRRVQEVARIIRKTLATQTEIDQLRTTPERIREMVCPSFDMETIKHLQERIYERTGGSARMLDYEEIDEPQVSKKIPAGLAGDPNNIQGAQKCKHCEENVVSSFRAARNDEERFTELFTQKRDKWRKIHGEVKKWCLARWAEWDIKYKGTWFTPGIIAKVPDECIPQAYYERLGGSNRPRTLPGGSLGSTFKHDAKQGDLVCQDCGVVVRENMVHEGEEFRNFSDKANRNHHNGMTNPLLSVAYNLGTSFGGSAFGVVGNYGAGAAGWGGGSKEKLLKKQDSQIQLNLSQYGKKEKATRTGYKDKQKLEAFAMMRGTCNALNLNNALSKKAEHLFSDFRDDRELLQDFEGIVAACLIEAFNHTSLAGQKTLQNTAGDQEQRDEDEREKVLSQKALRKMELHTTMDETDKVKALPSKKEDDKDLLKKPMADWNMDDVENWLTNAAGSIAEAQFELQGTKKAVLSGTKEEMEELMGESCMKLIEHLSAECDKTQSTSTNTKAYSSFSVKTKRASDGMGSLGMKWQGKDERGSGGAGGVGNSGRNTVTGKKSGEKKGRTPGQVFLLLTAMKFSRIITGEAKAEARGRLIHAFMKTTQEQQNLNKRKRKGEENAQRRLKQMIRKPHLNMNP